MLVVLTAKPNEPSQGPGFLTCHVGRRKISLSTQQNTTPDLTGCSKFSSTTTEQSASQNTHSTPILSSLQGRASTTWVIRVRDSVPKEEGVGACPWGRRRYLTSGQGLRVPGQGLPVFCSLPLPSPFEPPRNATYWRVRISTARVSGLRGLERPPSRRWWWRRPPSVKCRIEGSVPAEGRGSYSFFYEGAGRASRSTKRWISSAG